MLRSVLLAALACLCASAATRGEDYKVGLARVVITPEAPLWLSGYAHRTRPAEGKEHDLWAKAAAFESADGVRLVVVTMDLGSVNPRMTEEVAAAAEFRFGLPRASLVFNCSHTHCAPEIAEERRVFHDLPEMEEAKLATYIAETNAKLVELIGDALGDLKPARIAVSRSEATFAFNRRHPSGIDENGVTDREVPVMQIADAAGRLRAVLFGYACHNTTLSYQRYCGDYAGFAQYAVEEDHPGVQAMFVMGCGGDQNPQPRHGAAAVDHARRHGRELADAVKHALANQPRPVRGPLHVAHETATLDLESPPGIEQLQRDAASSAESVVARKARYLLDLLERGEKLPATESCPLHVARFGDNLLMIFIGGETVVDYSLRCKVDFAGPFVWVAGYCDDVFAYLPSRRVLLEGGYEGSGNIIHQLTPAPFTPNVEKQVMDCLEKLVTNAGQSL